MHRALAPFGITHPSQINLLGDREPAVRAALCSLLGETPTQAPGEIAAPSSPPLANAGGPFTHWLGRGYDPVPAARRGYPVTPGSKLKPEGLGKIPTLKTSQGLYYGYPWTTPERATAADAVRWDRWHAEQPINVSVRTGVGEVKVIGLDIDVPAGGPISAAEIRELALARLGPATTRRGKGEKVLLAYRTDDDISKHRLAWSGGEYAVEIIGRGNQFVAFGQHPAGMMYEWDDERPAAELTVVTLAQVQAFLS
ncbi:MAG: bifunctional DNA primase/polymerase [Gemmatimonadales bacterium]